MSRYYNMYVMVSKAKFLEDLPHEDFVLDEADYERIMRQPASTGNGGY